MQPWSQVELGLDTDALDERFDGEIVIDERLTALARANALTVWRSDAERIDVDPGTAAVATVLRCVAHPHPDCRFRWVRIAVDLAGARGAQVLDMSPRDEVAEPVKITTTRKAALSFAFDPVPLTPEAAYERASEQNVYFPTLTASGIRLRTAVWTFARAGENPLHVDRDLHLLLSTPADSTTVPVSITIRAQVEATGIAGLIPLVGRRSADFTALRDLAS